MKKSLIAIGLFLMIGIFTNANAQIRVSINTYPRQVYYRHQPVYYSQQAYVAQQPVYIAPQPVYVNPAPVIVVGPRRGYYGHAAYVGRGYGGYYGGYRHHHCR